MISIRKAIIVITFMFLLPVILFFGRLIYVTTLKVETIDRVSSGDGVYEVVLQSVGKPKWSGDASGRLVLEKAGQTISSTKFEIANDGVPISERSWKAAWYTDYAEIILSGSEQLDEQFILFFNGETDSLRLTTKYGREPEALTPPNVVEDIPEEVPSEVYELSPEEQEILDGYQSIYKILSGNSSENAAIYYGAKPDSSKSILFEDDSRIDCLVYDRKSKNGNCGLYVRFQCDKGINGAYDLNDAAIADIYAYVYEDGSVISSGKKNWSDIASTEYQSITGEF